MPPTPPSPSSQSLVGMGPSGQATMVRTDADGYLLMSTWRNDQISSGRLFYISDVATISIARNFRIAVGTNPIDMKFNVSAGLGTPITLTEGTTAGTGGTAITLQNFNRTSSNTINMTALLNPASLSGGNVIFSSQAGFGTLTPSAGSLQQGLADVAVYWRLNANTNYVLSYTPGLSIATIMNATFFEVIP